jgi:hypothetical protein
MRGRYSTVHGVYPDAARAQHAVEMFSEQGFPRDNISIVSAGLESSRRFTVEKHTKAPEGAVAGGALGAALGAVLVMAGLLGMRLDIPEMDVLFAADPVISVLAAIGAGGLVGGILGALIGVMVPKFEARSYDRWLRRGGVLVSVFCGDFRRAEQAEAILKATGADHVGSGNEAGSGALPAGL